MTHEELLERIRKELNLPNFNAFLDPDKEYSEEEYQKFKKDLVDYYEQYVNNIEGYFPGVP